MRISSVQLKEGSHCA